MILSVLPQSMYRQQCLWTAKSRRRGIVLPITIAFCLVVFIFLTVSETYNCDIPVLVSKYDRAYSMHTNVVIRRDGKVYKYDRSSPLIFISGVNLSGSELLRDILDSHPGIRCSSNEHFITKVLRMQHMWMTNKNESLRLREGGISKGVLDAAIGAFTLEFLARSGEPADYLCHQDFGSIKYADHLFSIFPQSKFILVVRDPIHYAHSKMLDHNLTRFNETLFKQYLEDWDKHMLTMDTVCQDLRHMSMIDLPRCRTIYYETLFLQPKLLTLSILQFIFSNESVERLPENMESQLQPGTNDDLLGWYGYVPKHVISSIGRGQFQVVGRLGYSHVGYPPNYHLLYNMAE